MAKDRPRRSLFAEELHEFIHFMIKLMGYVLQFCLALQALWSNCDAHEHLHVCSQKTEGSKRPSVKYHNPIRHVRFLSFEKVGLPTNLGHSNHKGSVNRV